MNVELNGTIKLVFAEVQINDNLSKKEVVITIDEDTQWPQDICVQALNGKIDLIKDITTGSKARLFVNLKGGKPVNGKYYNQLNLWSIEKNG